MLRGTTVRLPVLTLSVSTLAGCAARTVTAQGVAAGWPEIALAAGAGGLALGVVAVAVRRGRRGGSARTRGSGAWTVTADGPRPEGGTFTLVPGGALSAAGGDQSPEPSPVDSAPAGTDDEPFTATAAGADDPVFGAVSSGVDDPVFHAAGLGRDERTADNGVEGPDVVSDPGVADRAGGMSADDVTAAGAVRSPASSWWLDDEIPAHDPLAAPDPDADDRFADGGSYADDRFADGGPYADDGSADGGPYADDGSADGDPYADDGSADGDPTASTAAAEQHDDEAADDAEPGSLGHP